MATQSTPTLLIASFGTFVGVATVTTMFIIIFPPYGNEVFTDQALHQHNWFRAIHRSPPLSYDHKLIQKATEMIINMTQSSGYMRFDSLNAEYLMAALPSYRKPNGVELTSVWYSGEYDYNYTSHFGSTQFANVVWKSSQRIGCAYKLFFIQGNPTSKEAIGREDRHEILAICCYDPYIDESSEANNVFPPPPPLPN